MASAAKTSNLDLPQWVDSEMITRSDMNAAFLAIDGLVETGTFTPTLAGSTVAGSHTYTAQSGIYTKIFNLVTVSIYIRINTLDSGWSGNLLISGLPYPTKSTSGLGFAGSVGWLSNIVLDGSPGAYATHNASSITLRNIKTNAAGSNITTANVSNGAYLFVSMTYQA